YFPDRGRMGALEPQDRPCRNTTEYGVCNWAIETGDAEEYCRSCRLNQTIPNLAEPGSKGAWGRLETAKRRLLFSLLDLGLPVIGKGEDPVKGMAFAFLRDGPVGGKAKVLTGHAEGLITINIAEADPPQLEKARIELGEAYRTLLGHFRHESGHYYWELLIRESPQLSAFRDRFGDERADYAEASQRHYTLGPPRDWSERHVSAYGSMHPWEDFAETWAHYLHMTDTLETARSHGLGFKPQPSTAPGIASPATVVLRQLQLTSFSSLIGAWLPLTLTLNELSRSMGVPDSYPFVLSAVAIEKLRFVHEEIERHRGSAPPPPEAKPRT
ncbi:MAG TPA: putative zinc-binding metallopeptidase, partial [Planctomycetota bacterium]|nr:putative zinc-binding metallopeptidase [Planctomycetota bacterium]